MKKIVIDCSIPAGEPGHEKVVELTQEEIDALNLPVDPNE